MPVLPSPAAGPLARRVLPFLLLAWPIVLGPAAVRAQGAGTTGAQVLTLTAGTRAAALGGAYVGMGGDADVVFYNPAGLGAVGTGLSLGYQEYVEDVVLGTMAGALSLGPVRVGAGIVYLGTDGIPEVVPDARYGERGEPTGRMVEATEAAARFAVAVPFGGGRTSLGAAMGVVTSTLAGTEETGVWADLGAQYRGEGHAIGASVRHLGPPLAERDGGDIELPFEARIGVVLDAASGALGGLLSSDVVWDIRGEELGLAVGLEGGLLSDGAGPEAVLRVGATLGEGEHLGRLRFGAGVGLGGLALDYTLQTFEYLGTIHRVGVRWAP